MACISFIPFFIKKREGCMKAKQKVFKKLSNAYQKTKIEISSNFTIASTI